MPRLSNPTGVLAFATLATVLAFTGASWSAVSPSEKCEAGKGGAVGKYAGCVLKARRTLLLTGDLGRFNSAVTKCATSMNLAFTKAEVGAGLGVCPTEGDSEDIADFTDACADVITNALGGGALPTDLTACYSDLATCESGFLTCDGDLATCLADLDTCANDPANGLVQTGQTRCYNSGGSVIPCAGTGQDSDFDAGQAASFLDNGDGTITDVRTGLMWEKHSNDGGLHDKDNTFTWDAAFDQIDDINAAAFAGHTDWRMPNVRELESIMDFGVDFPTTGAAFDTSCPASCTVLTCSCTRSVQFWTSTTYEPDPTCAWAVGFALGDRAGVLKTSTFAVRAVRGGL